ncbi:MAG: 16S rRNA (guanine(966)-N(2))-methyltransferase RsmD [Clostridia bacterium]|nr:16S rRNA (guanine(966)-N(2))-methyltransferase RsmD [Clostridia bacterium]
MRIIAGEAGSRKIEAPEGRNTRPTLDRVRENLFNMLQGRIHGARVLDLFAGSGAVSFEALSRGAAFCVLCDHDRKANAVERKNCTALNMQSRCEILQMEWSQAVSRLTAGGDCFDLIYLDPPYEMQDLRGVTEALLPLLAEDGLLMVESEKDARVQVSEHLSLSKDRRWGIARVSFYMKTEESQKAEAASGGDAE